MKGFAKFIAISGIGFLLDMGLALVLHERLGLPLWAAATISFFAVACVNYVLFEFWLFRGAGGTASGGRLIGVLLASVAAAVARIGTILALGRPVTAMLGEGRAHDISLLVAGGGVSVIANFLLNKLVVFKGRGIDSAGGPGL